MKSRQSDTGWDAQVDEAEQVEDPVPVASVASSLHSGTGTGTGTGTGDHPTAHLLNPGHDILDTMADRKKGFRWQVEKICEEVGLSTTEVLEWLGHLEALDLVRFQGAPYALRGWMLTDFGAGCVGVLQRQGRARK